MKTSTDRILTTHAGSLPRSGALIAAYQTQASNEKLGQCLHDAVGDVVRMQIDAGIDVVNDGEFGKPMTNEVDYGAWSTYVYGRLAGYELRDPPDDDGVLEAILGKSRDRRDFPGFYGAGGDGIGAVKGRHVYQIPVNTGEIRYTGQGLIERDIANLKDALASSEPTDAFMSSVFTGVQVLPTEHYGSADEEAAAIAEAMREEYLAIIDAGLNLQIDDPILVNVYEMHYSLAGDVAGYRKWAQSHVELVNHALRGIPEDRIRYHLCWGSWNGPHSADLPLADVIDLLIQINASQYSFEAANARHEHEWKVWEDVSLPDGRALIPGVVTHKTTVLEHPELVADRIVRFAGIVGRENVIAGTDCGFGGRMHSELAWAKLRALSEGAALASRQLWS